MAQNSPDKPFIATWIRRARIAAAVAVVWGAMHYVAEATVLPTGMDRPTVLVGAEHPLLALPLIGLLVLAGAWLGAVIAGPRRPGIGLIVVGLALACWSATRGTMTEWLKLRMVEPHAPASPAYWPLIGEYAFWLVCTLGALVLGELAMLGGRIGDAAARKAALRRGLGLDATAIELRHGLLATLLTAVIAGVLMLFLPGPRTSPSPWKQVYFAIVVSFLVGVIVARRVTAAERPLWYCLAPFLVGLFGVIWAGFNPTLPEPYAHVNVIAASGLVQALPIQMAAVATVTILWVLRPAESEESEVRGGAAPRGDTARKASGREGGAS